MYCIIICKYTHIYGVSITIRIKFIQYVLMESEKVYVKSLNEKSLYKLMFEYVLLKNYKL